MHGPSHFLTPRHQSFLFSLISKVIGKVAETFVFVYVGMALPTLHYTQTVWRLGAVALLSCFLGRWHIFVFSTLVNAVRRRSHCTSPPKIDLSHMVVMWFAGLRGGVAFAIASVSLHRLDFPAHCGGVLLNNRTGDADPRCDAFDQVQNDSTAILHVRITHL